MQIIKRTAQRSQQHERAPTVQASELRKRSAGKPNMHKTWPIGKRKIRQRSFQFARRHMQLALNQDEGHIAVA